MKKVLLTGGTGFIEQYLAKKLLQDTIVVICIVRSMAKAKKILGSHENLIIIECDMDSISNLHKIIPDRDIDMCYHLAWNGVSGVALTKYSLQLENVTNTLQLLEQLRLMKIPKFVGAGSIHEDECKYIMDATALVTKNNMYKSAKIACHYMARTYCNTNNIDFFWPIITNTYGIGECSERLIIRTIAMLLNGEEVHFSSGEQNYDFIYVTDVANALYLIGKYGNPNKKYIISNSTILKLKDYLVALGKIVNSNALLHFGEKNLIAIDLPLACFDNSNLVTDTEFKVEISFEQGIYKTTEWLKNQNN